jgi:hypothetical protein
MAQNILQGFEALEVIVSDNCNIPYTNIVSEGISQAVNTNELIAAGTTNFIKEGVKELDIVYNTTTGAGATVISVKDDVTLTLNADIFTNLGGTENFIVYKANPVDGSYPNANNGCVLYVGVSGDLKVDTISGSNVIFKNVPVGFFPVQVKKVYATNTDAKEIIALWG